MLLRNSRGLVKNIQRCRCIVKSPASGEPSGQISGSCWALNTELSSWEFPVSDLQRLVVMLHKIHPTGWTHMFLLGVNVKWTTTSAGMAVPCFSFLYSRHHPCFGRSKASHQAQSACWMLVYVCVWIPGIIPAHTMPTPGDFTSRPLC